MWELVAAAKNGVVDAALEKDITPEELIQTIENNRLYGRIQVHRGKEGRIIRMVGLNTLAVGWDVPTLICDATGDATLLKAIWPQLDVAKPHGWGQLPRPKSVRVFQCVNRAISKWAVAIEGKTATDGKNAKERERRIEGARRLYAAVLMKALEYGGADVGVISYKSTKEWIKSTASCRSGSSSCIGATSPAPTPCRRCGRCL